jgi:hypothetical protein
MAVKGVKGENRCTVCGQKIQHNYSVFFQYHILLYNALTASFPCVTVSEEAGIELSNSNKSCLDTRRLLTTAPCLTRSSGACVSPP